MTDRIIEDGKEVIALESIERIDFAVNQMKGMLKEFKGLLTTAEIEPLIQSIQTVESSTNALNESILSSL